MRVWHVWFCCQLKLLGLTHCKIVHSTLKYSKCKVGGSLGTGEALRCEQTLWKSNALREDKTTVWQCLTATCRISVVWVLFFDWVDFFFPLSRWKSWIRANTTCLHARPVSLCRCSGNKLWDDFQCIVPSVWWEWNLLPTANHLWFLAFAQCEFQPLHEQHMWPRWKTLPWRRPQRPWCRVCNLFARCCDDRRGKTQRPLHEPNDLLRTSCQWLPFSEIQWFFLILFSLLPR